MLWKLGLHSENHYPHMKGLTFSNATKTQKGHLTFGVTEVGIVPCLSATSFLHTKPLQSWWKLLDSTVIVIQPGISAVATTPKMLYKLVDFLWGHLDFTKRLIFSPSMSSEAFWSSDLSCSEHLYHLHVVGYHFFSDTETGDACLWDSEGGETVSHANASRQLCVCLLAVSCVLGHSDIGSCLIQFQSLELREDLTPCLPDTETSRIPGCSLALETKE